MNKATRRQAIKATAAAIGITGVGIGVNATQTKCCGERNINASRR